MSKKDEALKLALENAQPSFMAPGWTLVRNEDITAIREALAEQETVLPGGGHVPAVPVAVYGYCPECGGAGVMRERRPNGDDKCTNGHKYPSSKALAKQPAQPQEPVAWATQMNEYGHIHWGAKRPEYPMVYEFPLYTPPPASKPWVGLTDEERNDMINAAYDDHYNRRVSDTDLEIAKAVEFKLREKNA